MITLKVNDLFFVPADINNATRGIKLSFRHGKTEHNKLGLFTGWEDAPLGVEEARQAGRLLKLHV
jgi:hypothetical protein